MAIELQLAGASSPNILIYQDAAGVEFAPLDGVGAPGAARTQVTDQRASWIGGTADQDGGFSVDWYSGGQLHVASYDAQGRLISPPSVVADAPMSNPPLAFTSLASGTTTYLNSGAYEVATVGADGTSFTVQDYDANGRAQGYGSFYGAYMGAPAAVGPVLASLATGGYALAYVRGSGPQNYLLVNSPAQPNGQNVASSLESNSWTVVGLPDGGFVAGWIAKGTDGLDYAFAREYTLGGVAVSEAVQLGHALDTAAPVIDVRSTGVYSVSWNGASGGAVQFTEAQESLGVSDRPPPTEPQPPTVTWLQPHGAPQALTGSAGWTSYASVGLYISVVGTKDDGYGSHGAVEQSYSGERPILSQTTLQGFASAGQTLTPEITSLDSGEIAPVGLYPMEYYKVSYAENSDYEIYSLNNKLVFQHNSYTSPTASFTALVSGNYLVTDSANASVGFYNGAGNPIAWFTLPSGAPANPTASGLDNGGFVFNYQHSDRLDIYDGSGHLQNTAHLGAPVAPFAMGASADGSKGFAEAWLSPQAGGNGFATSVDVQMFDNSGRALTGAIAVAQDLDPWHTQFKLVDLGGAQHVAVMWSQGGATFAVMTGTDIYGQNPGAGQVQSTGLALSLSDMHVLPTPQYAVGIAYLQDGDAWAELFNPVTGAIQRADLGASAGDLSTIHALTTQNGGIAVSWHSPSGAIEASVLEWNGAVSRPVQISGDLLGVDSNHNAYAVHDSGGILMAETFGLSNDSFFLPG